LVPRRSNFESGPDDRGQRWLGCGERGKTLDAQASTPIWGWQKPIDAGRLVPT
jgi:hypothetical protein